MDSSIIAEGFIDEWFFLDSWEASNVASLNFGINV